MEPLENDHRETTDERSSDFLSKLSKKWVKMHNYVLFLIYQLSHNTRVIFNIPKTGNWG